MRWSYILAVIGVLDATVLASLSFVLATRHVKLHPELEPIYGGSVYKGQMNPGFVGDAASLAGSRKSLNLQPVMLMPHLDHDRYSRVFASHRRIQIVSCLQSSLCIFCAELPVVNLIWLIFLALGFFI
ncbi:uncharacterized protein [Palaemon carinicauda]|uniref:uncharacterized protein n=1 Tax=Palaemon carinicauda TaxID=392227 RepID=UPI0035B61611